MLETNSFRTIGPTTYLSPIPSVLVGCADPANGIKPNLITVAWAGVVCTRPPMVSVSIRKERYSHAIISRTGEFTVNLVGKHLLKAMDFCGVKSGRDVDKFRALGLGTEDPEAISVPGIRQLPLTLECKVVYAQQQYPEHMMDAELPTHYPENSKDIHADYHTAYYGQILSAYIIE